MTLAEIKQAIADGKTVCWGNVGYTVVNAQQHKKDNYLIKHHSGHCIGLTWADGTTLNGKEDEFFIKS